MFPETILARIYKVKFIAGVKKHTTGKVQFLFVKLSFWEED